MRISAQSTFWTTYTKWWVLLKSDALRSSCTDHAFDITNIIGKN